MSEKVVEVTHSLSVNGNYKNPGKTDAVQLAVKFGLPKDEAEAVFEEIIRRTMHRL